MKIARLISNEEIEYKNDVERIKNVFASYQILIPEADIVNAWKRYSDSMAAGWMGLPESDEDIYLAIIKYLKVEEW